MEYIASNKVAWEEAFNNRDSAWGEDIVERVHREAYPFFQKDMADVLRKYDMKGRRLAHFCSNNGRELLSLVKCSGAGEGIGFDIAENQVEFANKKSEELKINCRFVATNILDIGEDYSGYFDVAFITIGTLCWFKNLGPFFDKISQCLSRNGFLLINEQHPVTDMLCAPGEELYDEATPTALRNSYFGKEWIDNGGAQYITKKNDCSKKFTSYSHSFSEIINSLCCSGMHIVHLQEFDYDIAGMFEHLDHKGVPLSYVLEVKK
jgi:SAM-dependent methyltransferase